MSSRAEVKAVLGIRCQRWVVALGLIGVVLLPGCKLFRGKGDAPKQPASCVDELATVRELKLDLDGDLPVKIRATLEGTVHLVELSTKLDRDVSDACMGLARDLGSAEFKLDDALPPGEHAKAACEEAAQRVKAAREAGGVVLLSYPEAPLCSVSLDDYARCATDCDMTMASFSSGVACEPESALGRCEARCDGSCLLLGSDACKGTCRGSCKGACDADFHGKCGGTCRGTCDGQPSSGKCKGTCEGKCSGDADGNCQGKCTGECAGTCLNKSTKAKCAGTCLGTCSEAFNAPRCGAMNTPAEMVPECAAMCDAKYARELNCQGGYVAISVYNSTKEGAGERLKSALDRQATTLLTVSEGMKAPVDRAHEAITSAYASIDEQLADSGALPEPVSKCLETANKKREGAMMALSQLREAATAVLLAVKN